jgi:hypothetical protein
MPEPSDLTIPPDSLDSTKERVMSANNANEIYEHIKQLGNDPKHRQRWIWELMQNAQDVAIGNEVNVSIIYDGRQVTFTHNGQDFSEEDITHLIYHGSSKPGLAGKTGKFGTGFMTTHLLSKKVRVKGSLQDGRSFDFILDRLATDGVDMLRVLDASWEGFKASIKPNDPQSVTSFTYIDLTVTDTLATVEPVLASMTELMPPVMAFSGIIKKVSINNRGTEQEFYVKDDTKVDEIHISCTSPAGTTVLLTRDIPSLNTKIAIPSDESGNIILLAKTTPRLFITFPLVGTDLAFPLPFLIHSQKFEPNKEREKIWIEADTPETAVNKSILDAAFNAYHECCEKVAGVPSYHQTHLLADLGQLPTTEWLDKIWYGKQLNVLFQKMDQLPLVVSNAKEVKISLNDAVIPYTNEENFTALWTILNYLHNDKVPILLQAHYWKKLIEDRATFFEGMRHASARNLRDCCKEIDTVPANKIEAVTVTGITAPEFMVCFVKTLESFKEQVLWTEFAVLPDQAENLKKSGALKSEDDGEEFMGETLKNIAAGLELKVREELLHPTIIITSKDHQLQPYKKSTLVNALLERVKAAAMAEKSVSFQHSTRLFLQWLLQEDRQLSLPGYPLLMHNNKWEKILSGTDRLLCPVSLWDIAFQTFEELFPEEFVLAADYAFIFAQEELLKKSASWLLKTPLYAEPEVIKSDNIRHLVTTREDKEKLSTNQNENVEWAMLNTVLVSQIAYFNKPQDKSVIDLARGSLKRTQQLLEMITGVLLHTDTTGFSRTLIEVTAGSLSVSVGVFPSNWLRDVKALRWIKDRSSKSADRPSVESLLPYFDRVLENMVLYNSLQKPEVARWLHFLDIGVGDLLRNIRAGDNGAEKMDWDQSYVSILMNDRLTPEKVTAILGDQELITAFENKRRDDDTRRKNKEIGTRVEEAFELAIQEHPGYKIRREPIGSDYIIESNDDHYLLIDRPNKKTFTIEIKSSRASQVKMTAKQGDTAHKLRENYILCVVPLNSDGTETFVNSDYIRANATFVTDIATLLDSRVENVNQLNTLKNSATIPINGGSIWTDIEGMNVRYVVGRSIWSNQRQEVFDFLSFLSGKVL